MRILALTSLCIAAVCAVDLGRPIKGPIFMEPYEAVVGPSSRNKNDRKYIKAIDNEKGTQKDETVMDVQRNLAKINFLNRNGALAGAKAKNGFAQGVFKGEDEKINRVAAVDFGDSGKAARANDFVNTMRNREEGENKHADLTGNGHRLDTVMENNGERFVADGDKATYVNEVASFNKGQSGNGQFLVDNKESGEDTVHDWKVNKDGQDWKAELAEPNAGRFGFHKICKAEKVGESICTDQNGKRIGKVVSDAEGNAVVYASDPVTGKSDVAVASAHCGKTLDGDQDDYDCKIGQNGLFVASVEKYEGSNCLSEYGVAGDQDIEIQEPLTFNYKHEIDGNTGAKQFYFPSCFDMSANVELKNFTRDDLQHFGKRLALQYEATVLPIGKLECKDRGTCNDNEDSCYYCNWCDKQKQSTRLDAAFGNWNADGLCGVSGQDVMRVKTTVCPPPKAFDWAHCSGFQQKSGLFDALRNKNQKKRADLNVIQKFYLLPENMDEIRTKCKSQSQTSFFNILGRAKLYNRYFAWISKNLERSNNGAAIVANDQQLYTFCVGEAIAKSVGPEGNYDKTKGKMVGCRRATINFSIAGTHKDASNFMLKALEYSGGVNSLFEKKECPKVDALENAQLRG